ncbi:MAG: amidohydrolase family protein [Alphaproteobacteria bacterium]
MASPLAPVIEPDLPIVDPHHHLWLHPGERYMFDDFVADVESGHNIASTVFVECSAMYRQTGPVAMRPVGEAEFVAGMAAMSASGHFGKTRICEGFVGTADLTLGAGVDDVLEALAVASGGRLRGIRVSAIWDADPSVNSGTRSFAPRGLLADRRFREGFARLHRRGLAYDAWQYHPQLPEVVQLADAFPDTTIVVNHVGGLLGGGPYARPGLFEAWKPLVAEAAKRPNIVMKVGGLAARRCGFAYLPRPTEEELVAAWGPYLLACIELFGPDRCMFESNFPPDRVACSYRTLWNVFKRLASGFSSSEKAKVFSGTACRVYHLQPA